MSISYWQDTVKNQTNDRNQRPIPRRTDVAVVGGGIAGILIAYYLQSAGKKVVLLEAKHILEGTTACTTAKVTSQHGLVYRDLERYFGLEFSSLYASANEEAISEYRRLIRKKKIDCDWEDVNAYIYSLGDPKRVEREIESSCNAGIKAEWTDQTELPFPVTAAVCFPNQGKFHPLKFLTCLAEELTIFENIRVKEVRNQEVIWDGGALQAEDVVIATHYPFINIPGFYFLKMHQERSYVVAMEHDDHLHHHYLEESSHCSFRSHDKLLFLGGGGHRTGEHDHAVYDDLWLRAKKWFPQARARYFWSTQDCMTDDRLPYIGHYSLETPHLYLATGFGKWGMTNAMVAARLISDLIINGHSPYAFLYDPGRLKISASAKQFFIDGSEVIKGLGKSIFSIGPHHIGNLENDHAKIIDHHGSLVAVYRDSNGKDTAVSGVCSHLGCAVHWNSDEKIYECPCHGSCFDAHGRLLGGPALKNLEPVALDHLDQE
ncbi:MAG TPA: FAD-dependent oxidoreductase [Firmicutes bacterium]|nr:FAD-dependent oxidoreductase [Bacillota bacterium]